MRLSEQNACEIEVGLITVVFHTGFSVLETLARAQITPHCTTPPPPVVDNPFSKWAKGPNGGTWQSISLCVMTFTYEN